MSIIVLTRSINGRASGGNHINIGLSVGGTSFSNLLRGLATFDALFLLVSWYFKSNSQQGQIRYEIALTRSYLTDSCRVFTLQLEYGQRRVKSNNYLHFDELSSSWLDCNPWPIIRCKITVQRTRLRDDALFHFFVSLKLNSSKWQILLKYFHNLVFSQISWNTGLMQFWTEFGPIFFYVSDFITANVLKTIVRTHAWKHIPT